MLSRLQIKISMIPKMSPYLKTRMIKKYELIRTVKLFQHETGIGDLRMALALQIKTRDNLL